MSLADSKHYPNTQSIGKEKALELVKSGWWKDRNNREIAEFQFLTKELSCPFDVFHSALEATIGRPVYTHELALNYDGLWEELFDGKEPPSIESIIGLLPAQKTILIKL